MTPQLLKSIFMGAILVIFSLILGNLSVGDARTPIIIMGALGMFALLNWLGERCWVLIFILPPILQILPLGGLAIISPQYSLAMLILGYWTVLRIMGRVTFTWKSLPVTDFIVLAIACVFISRFIANPVSIAMLASEDAEYVGGKEYFLCIFATIFYFTMSVIPINAEQLQKVIKYVALFTLIATLFNSSLGISETSDIAEKAQTGRFGLFAGLGMVIFTTLLCFYSPLNILLSPHKLFLMLAAALGVLMSGFREQFLQLCLVFAYMSIIRKQFIIFIILACMGYGAVFILSEEKILQDMPLGIQRALSPLPGIEIDPMILADADFSIDWRKEMWIVALDPRSGYIKDFVWGDGYKIATSDLRDHQLLLDRGIEVIGNHDYFMDMGVWHNCFIHLIQRVGYVGLSVFIIFCLITSWYNYRLLTSYRNSKDFPYIAFTLMSVVPGFIVTFASAGTTQKLLGAYFALTITKILYLNAKKQGIIKPFLQQNAYVPIMIRKDNKSMTS